MLKRIFCIQIISLILCSCSTFPLRGNNTTNTDFIKLSREENEIIKLSKTLTEKLNGNWVQEERYKNERISATFRIHLERDGSIESFKLCDSFCIDDFNNECETFVINTKKTILKSFPIKELLSINYSNWEYLWLSFGSKEGNELFKKQQVIK